MNDTQAKRIMFYDETQKQFVVITIEADNQESLSGNEPTDNNENADTRSYQLLA